jgi:quercetin dioxygenase-like cupin family protein
MRRPTTTIGMALLLTFGTAPLVGGPQPMAAQTPPGLTRTVLLDNSSVLVARLTMAPGSREEVHTHPFSAVVTHLTAGLVEMRLGDSTVTEHRSIGFAEFIPKEVPHAAANVGRAPFDLVTVALLPDRVRASSAPTSAAPPGITRTGVIENPEARATRVSFAPGAREPVHAHPYDLVLVQLSPGTVEVLIGDARTTRTYTAGEVLFLPRDMPHAVSNSGSASFDVLSVAVK